MKLLDVQEAQHRAARTALARLAGYCVVAAFAIGGMYGAALRLATVARDSALDTRPCPDCRGERASRIDAEPPTDGGAGDPSPGSAGE